MKDGRLQVTSRVASQLKMLSSQEKHEEVIDDVSSELVENFSRNEEICFVFIRLVVLVENIAVGAESCGFDSRAGQIEHRVVINSSPLRSFFGAVLSSR